MKLLSIPINRTIKMEMMEKKRKINNRDKFYARNGQKKHFLVLKECNDAIFVTRLGFTYKKGRLIDLTLGHITFFNTESYHDTVTHRFSTISNDNHQCPQNVTILYLLFL